MKNITTREQVIEILKENNCYYSEIRKIDHNHTLSRFGGGGNWSDYGYITKLSRLGRGQHEKIDVIPDFRMDEIGFLKLSFDFSYYKDFEFYIAPQNTAKSIEEINSFFGKMFTAIHEAFFLTDYDEMIRLDLDENLIISPNLQRYSPFTSCFEEIFKEFELNFECEKLKEEKEFELKREIRVYAYPGKEVLDYVLENINRKVYCGIYPDYKEANGEIIKKFIPDFHVPDNFVR